MVAVVVAAIQELYKRTMDQDEKIKALQLEIAEKNQKMKSLEQRLERLEKN